MHDPNRVFVLASALATSLLLASSSNAAEGTWSFAAPPRVQRQSVAIHDPVRHRLIEFGGENDRYLNLVRTLDLNPPGSAWKILATAGPAPAERKLHIGIYDAARDELVIYGGFGDVSVADTWKLSLAGTPTWTQLPTGAGIGSNYAGAAICDSIGDRVILFGGITAAGFTNAVWQYSLGAPTGWVALPVSGAPPAARGGHGMVLDTARNRVLVLGGVGPALSGPVDVWALSLGATPAWSQLTPLGPQPTGRSGVTATYDPIGDRVLMFGGHNGSYLSEVWSLSLSGTPTWTSVWTSRFPPPRYYARTVWDSDNQRMLMTSGSSEANDRTGGAWAFSATGTENWAPLLPVLNPITHFDSEMIADSTGDQIFLYTRASLWSLGGTSDVLVDRAPTGHPPFPSLGSSNYGYEEMLFDPTRRRLLALNSEGTGETLKLDVDAANPGWSAIGTGGPARTSATIYDPSGDRFICYGTNGVLRLAAAGELSWTAFSAPGTAPMPRRDATAVYDPVRDRMWLLGGYVTCLCDPGARLYALDLTGAPS